MPALRRPLAAALLAVIAGPFAHAATGEQWAYTMAMVTPDGQTVPMNTVTACRSPASALMPAAQANCKVEDFKASGNKASYRLVCGPPQPMTMSGEVTRTGDTTVATMRMRQNGQEMLMKQTSRKLGPCDNPID